MAITITAQQRDFLYDEILERLGAIADIRMAVENKDWGAAQRLGMAFSDDLRLVTQDLGWGEGPGKPVELITPPDVLRRAMGRWRDALLGLDTSEEEERATLQASHERNERVIETCSEVLAALDGE